MLYTAILILLIQGHFLKIPQQEIKRSTSEPKNDSKKAKDKGMQEIILMDKNSDTFAQLETNIIKRNNQQREKQKKY